MSDTTRDLIEAATAAVASKATSAGALAAIFGFLASSSFIGLAGVSVGLLGLLVNWYFKARDDRRQETEWAARMRKLQRDSSAVPLGKIEEDE